MTNAKLNKRTASWLGIIMILFIVTKITSPLIFPYYVSNSDPNLYTTTLEYQAWIKLFINIFLRSTDIVIAIFLFIEAKKVKYNKILWLGLGLAFGIVAIVLFYIYRIYENTQNNNQNESSENVN